MKTQVTFCIAHQRPLLPDELYDYAIGLGHFRPEKGSHVSVLDPFWDHARPIACGAAGSYVIPRMMELNKLSAELAGICSYRKVVVRKHASIDDRNPERSWEAAQTLAPALTRDNTRPCEGSDFLIPGPIEYPNGAVGHYIHAHYAIDLFEYISIAYQIGVLTFSQVQDFSVERLFIEGGCELGVYPRQWLHKTLGCLESVGREFLKRCGSRIATYDRYQVRAVGFLAERLGSYLLLTELRTIYPEGIPPNVFGHLHVVLPDGAAYSRGLADSREP